ncbi:hypothetical protein BC937DRAFT_91311 [Endogone sp. FLAS-F59071]|nr:hypothetical protein BC937DRAFT_91311 [Endogone sp. FLAS-F59071]|eukprot:RUS16350.1 hypothetical protein BC937DRAFT_91311 [Endogone sp. FLAS-F59071]
MRKRPVTTLMFFVVLIILKIILLHSHDSRSLSLCNLTRVPNGIFLKFVTAFEVMDQDSMRCMIDNRGYSPAVTPLPVDETAFYCIIETLRRNLKDEGITNDSAVARLAEEVYPFISLFRSIFSILNSIDFIKIKSFWSWRESLPKTIVSMAPISIHFDVFMHSL